MTIGALGEIPEIIFKTPFFFLYFCAYKISHKSLTYFHHVNFCAGKQANAVKESETETEMNRNLL